MQTNHEALIDEASERGQLRRDNRELREQVKALEDALAQVKQTLELANAIDAAKPSPPKWLRRASKTGHAATPCLLLTDTHFDEVVRPEEVMNLNAYDRRIAGLRLKRLFEGTVEVAKDYITGHNYPGLCVLLGGDLISGDIHEELKETNEDTTLGTLLHWLEPLVAGLNLLAAEFGKVHVAGVVGNHGRRTRKPRAKLRVRDNYDWLLYQMLARELRGREGVTFQFPESTDCLVQVHDSQILLTHGDQFKGGSGISASMAPLLLGEHRKTRRHVAASRYGGEDVGFDLMVLGHFHSRYVTPRLIVGGALKGMDEYAFTANLEYQPPSQELFLVAPGRGVILNSPIWVQDRKAEKW